MLNLCQTFLFDCDGTLWNQLGLIEGSLELLNYLNKTNRKTFLITNNSTKSVEQYHEKCKSLGLPVKICNIICTANVAANYLKSKGIKGPIYLIGQKGLALELDKCGISHVGFEVNNSVQTNFDPMHTSSTNVAILDPHVSTVLVGYDSCFNFTKLLHATNYISRGCTFYATNEDAQMPSDGYICPGTGSLVASVKVASGVNPIVLGKPNSPMFDYLRENYQILPETTVVVGDRLDTDIAFGNNHGMHSVCVLTGVTSEELLSKVRNSPTEAHLIPNMVFSNVLEMLNRLKELDKISI